jgi:hypothetical protein
MKKQIMLSIVTVFVLLSSISITTGYANTIENKTINNQYVSPIEPEYPQIRSIRPTIHNEKGYYAIPADTQVTFSMDEESHPTSDIDISGNPFVIFDKSIDFGSNTLGHLFSKDGGITWPEETYVEWIFEDTYAVNPDISMCSDGIYAFGTYELATYEPDVNMMQYADINNPETWQLTYFDRSDRSTYVAETAATTIGDNTLAIACITDYDSGDLFLVDTIVINWNCYRGEDMWPGVIFYNWDSNENSQPLSHLSADAGEKLYFVAEQEKTSGLKSIMSYYCKVNETTDYLDWRSRQVAGGRSNATNPDVSVSGKRAYCVYMDDINGNQDIYIATTTAGTFWTKYAITNTPEDELYPVVHANGDKATCMFIRNNDLYVTRTEDTGKTWTEPTKVNDDTGTVVADFGALDISSSIGFWTSDKEGNNDIFCEEVGSAPLISIDEVKGGFGVKATVSNIGNAPSEDTPWSIDITGGFILIGAHAEGIITISQGSSTTIQSGFLFGLGSVTITVQVSDKVKTVEGFLLGPFMLGIE